MTTLHNVLAPLTDGRTRTQAAAGTQFATKTRPTHWGTDLRANVYDTPGDDVYAPCDMTLVMAGTGSGTGLSPIPWHSGRFQYWDLGVWGGDRMYLYLGHLHSHVVATTPGTTVKAGAHVAEMGGTGIGGRDTFVDHLHIGVAQNTPRPVGLLRNGAGWIDPVRWFARHGVDFNTTPPATISTAATPKEDTLSASEVQQIKDHITSEVDRLYDRLVTYGGLSWAKVGHNGENLRQLLWEAAKGAQAGFVNTNEIKTTNAEVVKAVASVAQSQGLTPEQVSALIDATAKAASDGAEKGAAEAVEAGVTVDITATTTANKKEG